MNHPSMKTLALFTLLFIAKAAVGCSCLPLREIKSQEDLKVYNFIALASVSTLSPVDSTKWGMRVRKSGDIGIRIIESFKGGNTTLLNDPSFDNDCAMNLKAGEQWLFFGTVSNGKIEVSRCGHSIRYRDTSEAREWWSFSGLKELDVLRAIYKRPVYSNAVQKQLYSNGTVEVAQTFKKGKLDGIRKIYYPDGRIYIEEKFKRGARTDFRNVYHKSGQLIETVHYFRGLIKKIIRYQDTTEIAWYLNFQSEHNDDLLFGDREHKPPYFKNLLDSLRKLKAWDKQIAYERRFTDNGRSYAYEMYNYKGNFEVKNYLDWHRQISEHTLYYDNGRSKMYIKQDNKSNKEIEYDYNKEGKRKDFIKTCNSCKYNFDKSIIAGAPEKIYVQ